MRNTIVYPITKEEIEQCLIAMAEELLYPASKIPAIGDMRPMLLYAAAKIVIESNFMPNVESI